MIIKTAILFSLAMAVTGCTTEPQSSNVRQPRQAEAPRVEPRSVTPAQREKRRTRQAQQETALVDSTITVSGTIEAGVECPRIRLDSGKVYSLIGMPRELSRPGTRVTVNGTIPMGSTCQQGDALMVNQASAAR